MDDKFIDKLVKEIESNITNENKQDVMWACCFVLAKICVCTCEYCEPMEAVRMGDVLETFGSLVIKLKQADIDWHKKHNLNADSDNG